MNLSNWLNVAELASGKAEVPTHMWLQSPHSIIKSILSLPLERGWWVPHSQRYSRDAVTCLITGISWAALQHPAPQASPQNHSWISGESPSVCFRQALSKTWESCTERNLDPMPSLGPPLLCGLRFCVSIFRQFLPKPTCQTFWHLLMAPGHLSCL